MGFPGDSEVKTPPALQKMQVQFLVWENPQERGNGNPLQYSCLENPVDRGAWWAAVDGSQMSPTRLSANAHAHCAPLGGM